MQQHRQQQHSAWSLAFCTMHNGYAWTRAVEQDFLVPSWQVFCMELECIQLRPTKEVQYSGLQAALGLVAGRFEHKLLLLLAFLYTFGVG